MLIGRFFSWYVVIVDGPGVLCLVLLMRSESSVIDISGQSVSLLKSEVEYVVSSLALSVISSSTSVMFSVSKESFSWSFLNMFFQCSLNKSSRSLCV